MDNGGSHKSEEIGKYIEKTGNKLQYSVHIDQEQMLLKIILINLNTILDMKLISSHI